MESKLRRDGYGPLVEMAGLDSIRQLIRISERAWELYFLSFTRGLEVQHREDTEILSRLVYHAQNCSYSIGLLTSWAQSLEALILLRTRFEQSLVSSYLVFVDKEKGFDQFRRSEYRMDLNSIRKMRNGGAPLMEFYEQLLGEKIKAAEKHAADREREANPDFTNDQKLSDSWTKLNKLEMAKERDKLRSSGHQISDFEFQNYYHGLYRLGTGMAHVDPNTLTHNYVSTAEDGVTLTPHIFQVFINLIQCAHFDIVQSFESANFSGVALIEDYEQLYQEYREVSESIISFEDLLSVLNSED